MELAQCKYENCAGSIGLGDITKAAAIPKAPHHLALGAICSSCGRAGQYVVERSAWDEAKRALAEVEAARISPVDQAIMEAQFELDGVETANDLIVYWQSLPHPPLREEHIGKCQCKDCRKRIYGW